MSIPGSASPLFFGAGAGEAAAFQIDRSLRFNSADSAYLNRTPSSAGNRKTWTWSGWVKRSELTGNAFIFGAGSGIMVGGAHTAFMFQSDQQLQAYDYTGSGYAYNIVTTRKFLDPAAWYHIVLAIDTSQSTSTDRVKFYINGALQTDFGTTSYPSQNYETYVNTSSIAHQIGHSNTDSFDGYLTEVHFIDGSQLAASDFGEYDDNNVWQPKDTSGLTFGTNGFRLKFDDNSSNAALGNDSSGNDNDWTVNNISAAGSAWNQSQTWSSSLSSSTGFRGSEPATNAFDGDTSSICSAVNNGVVTFTSPVTFASDSTIRVIVHGGDHTVTVNGGSDQTISAGSYQTVTFTNSSNSTFTMTFQRDTSADTGIRAIEIGGNVLVDSSVVDPDAEEIDSLIDTPTNYTASSGNNGGNYATLNPLDFAESGSPALSNGNLDAQAGSGWQSIAATIGNLTSGRWYWEVKLGGGSGHRTGLSSVSRTNASDSQLLGSGDIALNSSDGRVYVDGTEVGTGAGNLSGKTVGIALNLEANSVSFYQNNSLVHTVSSLSSTASWTPVHATRYAVLDHLNFGQRPFAYTPPTDHVSLCTKNLPDPTITKGSTAMDAVTYSGDGTNGRDITVNHSTDFVWIKSRNQDDNHILADIVRGTDKILFSQLNYAEYSDSSVANSVTAFNSDGFTVGNNASSAQTNQSGFTYVAWSWDAGTSTVSNTDGTITSQVCANQSTGFSIMTLTFPTYSGTSSVGHGLNAAPHWWIMKDRDSADGWYTGHISSGAGKYLRLETTGAETPSTSLWDNTLPSSSLIYNNGTAMTGAGDYLMLAWAPVEGYSAFGSYEGNGSASSGPYVFTGFKPRWILIKNVDNFGSGYDWFIFDTARDSFNVAQNILKANLSSAEADSNSIDILSNGFRIKTTAIGLNLNNHTHIYCAFAEHPFKTARAR